jgi:hypothetical protein
MNSDYISVDLVATVTSEPKRRGKDIYFDCVNSLEKTETTFNVIIKNDERPIDINEGDRIFIAKAGFWQSKGQNRLAVTQGSSIEVIRKRCNLGTKKV